MLFGELSGGLASGYRQTECRRFKYIKLVCVLAGTISQTTRLLHLYIYL